MCLFERTPPVSQDPFAHHPELKDEITPPATSFFRDFTVAKLTAIADEHGLPKGWWSTDDVREANRKTTLAVRRDQDLWVFGYGSLMWDPAFEFVDVRRAYVPNYARRFILKDIYGARGSHDTPGCMAALDHGEGCHGLAFRIAKGAIEQETEILWRRECVAPAYTPTFVKAELSDSSIEVLAFLADHAAEQIEPDLPRDTQVRYLATGEGFLGTSAAYLRNVVSHFRSLGILDEEAETLLADVERYRSQHVCEARQDMGF